MNDELITNQTRRRLFRIYYQELTNALDSLEDCYSPDLLDDRDLGDDAAFVARVLRVWNGDFDD